MSGIRSIDEERKKKEGKRERGKEKEKQLMKCFSIQSYLITSDHQFCRKRHFFIISEVGELREWQVGVTAIKVKLQPVLPELQVGRCKQKTGSALTSFPKKTMNIPE